MKRDVLLDTGPLVAFLNRRDTYHDWARQQWSQIAPPMLTCEAVLSEACFLLAHTPAGGEAVLKLVERGIMAIPFRLEDHVQPLARLLKKYSSVPMSLADACLVRLSELHARSSVFTLDGDFSIYRRNGRQRIPVLLPT